MPALIYSDLSYSHPDEQQLFTGLNLTVSPGLTSLVGRNGSGKSTLLRLGAGELNPTEGSVRIGDREPASTRIAYLPQTSTALTIADAMGISAVVAALARIEAGSTDPADFETSGDNWDLADQATAALHRAGLPDNLAHRLDCLSGGERIHVALTGQLLGDPEVVLLDEPTTNLDAAAREKLIVVLHDLADRGRTVFFVSHDLELLEHAQATVELRAGECRTIGGPYSHYREIIAEEQRAARQRVAHAKGVLRRERGQRIAFAESAAARQKKGRLDAKTQGLPKILAGARKQQAQNTAAAMKKNHEAAEKDAIEGVARSSQEIRKEEQLRIDLPESHLPDAKTVLNLGDPALGRLVLVGPERLRITGGNGAGKTTALRRILHGDGIHVPHAVVPQDVPAGDAQTTVLDAIRAARADGTAQQAHAYAARFLFPGEQALKTTDLLSGGERVRLALAEALFRDPLPQLLVLDEPTNHLDIDAVDILTDALAAWDGALIYVTHDEGVAKRLGGRSVDVLHRSGT